MGVTFDSITLCVDPLTGRVRWSRDDFRKMPGEPRRFVAASLVCARVGVPPPAAG